MAAMQQMGKVASPLSGKVERNLEQARASIDMLGMLAEKTGGNLSPEEKSIIDRALYETRMNFVDESKKTDEKDEDKDKAGESTEANSQAANGGEADSENDQDKA